MHYVLIAEVVLIVVTTSSRQHARDNRLERPDRQHPGRDPRRQRRHRLPALSNCRPRTSIGRSRTSEFQDRTQPAARCGLEVEATEGLPGLNTMCESGRVKPPFFCALGSWPTGGEDAN